MKKILIISNSIMAETIAAILSGDEVETIFSDHKDALFIFASEDPTHIVICECEEKMIGEKTFADIAKSAINQKMIRCGFDDSKDDDYMKLPFKLEDLQVKLRNPP